MLRQRDSLGLGEQLNREWRRAGINFRVMLVGESGLGKTTFTRALLRPYVPEHLLDQGTLAEKLSEPVRGRTVGIQEIVHSVENDGFPVEVPAQPHVPPAKRPHRSPMVDLRLLFFICSQFEIIDCPGYGDSVDSTGWIDNILSYINKRFAEHYDALGNPPKQGGKDASMNGLQRDGLVHVCLYFIAAHRLKGVDLEFMRRLEPYVNLVPIIAKADTMTLAERDAFRRLVLGELRANGVRIFELSEGQASSAPNARAATPTRAPSNHEFAATPGVDVATAEVLGMPPSQAAPAAPRATTQPPPFAVCASEDGTRVYPWGTCCAEDPTHSDLSTLRSMLFASSMVDAKRSTLELFEQSYASSRREREAEQSAREARALRREHLAGRLAVLTVATSSVAIAAAGAFAVVQPEMAAAAVSAIVSAAEKIKQPRALFAAAARTAVALLEGAVERSRSRVSR